MNKIIYAYYIVLYMMTQCGKECCHVISPSVMEGFSGLLEQKQKNTTLK